MKDPLGHGSNPRGVATAAGYSVVQKPPLGHFIKSPTGEEHGPYFGARGAWSDAARLASVPSYANDLGAARMLASGTAKSDPAPVHDAWSSTPGGDRGDAGPVTDYSATGKSGPAVHDGGMAVRRAASLERLE